MATTLTEETQAMSGFARLMTTGLLIVLAVAGGACQTLTGQSAGGYLDDTTITTQVKARLAATQAETLTRVDVDTQGGTVYLTGIVASAEMKARAAEIAKTQEGVKRVVNNLQVNPTLAR